jgi:predicted AAA+ superfamily ATPase
MQFCNQNEKLHKMYKRDLEYALNELIKYFPIVSVSGPRQSGKSTLVKKVFNNLPYVLLEDRDVQLFAESDPRGFLAQYPNGAILDEIQRVPVLFTYLQGMADADPSRKFVLSGSQNYLMMEGITQSLAGRVGLLNLLPFSWNEMQIKDKGSANLLFNGGYPGIIANQIPKKIFFSSYVQTYIERDVRQLKNIGDLSLFMRFLKLCAGRAGQLLNVSALANDAGISPNTAASWLSVLENSYVIFLLNPYYQNWGKRLTKMSKLYFYDTGLLTYLLDIADEKQLDTHFAYGSIFENGIILEIMKKLINEGEKPQIYYWRDSNGNEMDLILETKGRLIPIEIKSAQTPADHLWKGFKKWNALSKIAPNAGYVIYGGEQSQTRSEVNLVSWKDMDKIFV